MSVHADENEHILQAVTQEIKKRIPDSAEKIIEFINQFYKTTALEDLRERNIEDLYGSILSFWSFLEKRQPSDVKVRVYNPQFEEHGWQSTHTIVEIIQRDAPFLVDSVVMELNRLGLTVHFVVTMGGLKVQRNTKNELVDLLPANASASAADIFEEAPMYVEIDRQTDTDTLQHIKICLEHVLHDVHIVVDAWQPMRDGVEAGAQQLKQEGAKSKSFSAAELQNAYEFLTWVIQDHFTFIALRDYSLEKTANRVQLKYIADSDLGLLQSDTEEHAPLICALDSPEIKRLLQGPAAITVSKADWLSTVHRPAWLDRIIIPLLNDKGEIMGERWVYGLFTAAAYHMRAQQIPLLSSKINAVMAQSGINPRSHTGRTLLNIIETLPRDDLFRATVDDLLTLAIGILHLQERQRIRMFALRYDCFISCLVYVPREGFSTELRESMQRVLEQALHAKDISFFTRFSESTLARIHFEIRIDPKENREYDFREIEQKLIDIGRSWRDELREHLVEYYGEEKGNELFQRYGSASTAGYREAFTSRAAVFDIRHLEKLREGAALEMNFYQPLDEGVGRLHFKVYRLHESIPLSDVVPILENMGLRVLSERPYEVALKDGTRAWINDFGMMPERAVDIDVVATKEVFQEAFANVWFNQAENDAFNKLVLLSNIHWREIMILRAYAKYMRQIRFNFSQHYIELAVVNNPTIAKLLIAFFKLRFDPQQQEHSAVEITKVEEALAKQLDAVTNLDEDRILRRYLELMRATVRTNYYQQQPNGQYKEYLSLKVDCYQIADLPLPIPKFEIFVYSPRYEGVHLRDDFVARGGIRWTDRREDFRDEILGLMKAQKVKNAQIVPGGAKGGFYPKNLPVEGDREAIQTEGIICYQGFISGLLDISDNLVHGELVLPSHVVRYDGDDPYLVVAADKGTATFSNIANQIALEYGFWLGDAFASGGSTGYDHKAMGITARGAWESVKRHFRELDIDIEKNDFTVVGIGDMAGDVFGNGLLHSDRIKLIAAFNHQHIFLDPNPDPVVSYAERKRLFNLPRSSWSDYNPELISKGGGVFKRSDKSIKLSPEIQKALGIKQDIMIPNDVIRAILKAPVDLLWNGGIGTFVKATHETHADVSDRTNDSIRINGNELMSKVVGEGGNLGLTHQARIEYALKGGRCYADFIDNSAGVDCSDHEVNIKILLDTVVNNGDLTVKQRNQLLAEMTDEVAYLVLRDNYLQTQAISLAAEQALVNVDLHSRYMDELERTGKLDRTLEGLPDTKTLLERKVMGVGLTRPEISTLVTYTKAIIKKEILDSNVPEDPALADMVELEFPQPLRRRFRKQMDQHSLRRQIIATQLVNQMVNEVGFTFSYRLHDETGAPASAILRAYSVVRAVFNLDEIWQQIEALDNKIPAVEQYGMMQQIIRVVRRATRWLLRNRRMKLDIAAAIQQFAPGVNQILRDLPLLLASTEIENYRARETKYLEIGASPVLAAFLASTRSFLSAFDLIEASITYKLSLADLVATYFSLGDKLELSWLRTQVIERVVENQWESLSREALRDDLNWQQRQLAVSVLMFNAPKAITREEKLQAWMKKYKPLIERWHYMLSELRRSPSLNTTIFFVATRELLDLTQTCFQQTVDMARASRSHAPSTGDTNVVTAKPQRRRTGKEG